MDCKPRILSENAQWSTFPSILFWGFRESWNEGKQWRNSGILELSCKKNGLNQAWDLEHLQVRAFCVRETSGLPAVYGHKMMGAWQSTMGVHEIWGYPMDKFWDVQRQVLFIGHSLGAGAAQLVKPSTKGSVFGSGFPTVSILREIWI